MTRKHQVSMILLGLFSILPSLGQADSSCVSVDLRKGNCLPPVRNQGDTGWCYANAAADLLSCRYGQAITAVDVAINYNREQVSKLSPHYDPAELRKSIQKEGYRYSILDGGDAGSAIQASGRDGACADWGIIKKDNKVAKTDDSLQWTLYQIENSEYFYRTRDHKHLSDAEVCNDLGLTQKLFSNPIPVKEFREIIEAASSAPHPEMAFIDQIEKVGCKHTLKVPNPIQIVHDTAHEVPTPEEKARLIREIDEGLEKGKPIAVGYYVHLDDLSKAGADNSKDVPYYQKSNNQHESVVAGSRLQNGQCEYLVKNSWGKACKDSKGVPVYDKKIQCDHGYYWVPKNIFTKDLIDFAYIGN